MVRLRRIGRAVMPAGALASVVLLAGGCPQYGPALLVDRVGDFTLPARLLVAAGQFLATFFLPYLFPIFG